MPGTILENLSGKKLAVLVSVFVVAQIASFLVGLISPIPASSQGILATNCIDTDAATKNSKWFTIDCPHKIDFHDPKATEGISADQIVFVVQMPLFGQDFSRWQQNLISILQFDVIYQKGQDLRDPVIELTIDARLAYSNKGKDGKRTPWQEYASAEEKRYMDCVMHPDVKDKEGYPYNCSMVPLFELGSLYHDYYLLNMRLPYSEKLNKNTNLRKIIDVYLHIIHMNGGYTKVWLGIKMVFFPIVGAILFWFWRRVHLLQRTPALLECMLVTLGGSLLCIDAPFEYLTLFFDMPYMLLLSDIFQGVFYATLMSFLLVFAGEHMLIQDHGEKHSIKLYWKHLSTIAIGCMSMLVFDLCERGTQLVNPFYSIWAKPIGTNLALSFIILAGICAGLYFFFLCFMIWRVFKNISIKRSVLPSMSQARRLHYEGIIYRFNFLMLATMICAAVTVISFILNQLSQSNKWDDEATLDLSSIIPMGVFGMWNLYICAMLILYAPSHKQWPSEPPTEGEEVEFSRLPTDPVSSNEISSLTSFTSKASIE